MNSLQILFGLVITIAFNLDIELETLIFDDVKFTKKLYGMLLIFSP